MAACRVFSPVDPRRSRLVSRFGVRPGRTTGLPTFHAGIDLGLREGFHRGIENPIFCVADGYVQAMGSDREERGPFYGYGNCIGIRHVGPDAGYWSFYAHMHAHAPTSAGFRESGTLVPKGTLLGWIGATTNRRFPGMGPHLHFEIRRARRDGSSPIPGPYKTYNVDPAAWLEARGLRFGFRGIIELGAGGCSVESVWR